MISDSLGSVCRDSLKFACRLDEICSARVVTDLSDQSYKTYDKLRKTDYFGQPLPESEWSPELEPNDASFRTPATPSWVEFTGRSWQLIEALYPVGKAYRRRINRAVIRFDLGDNALIVHPHFIRGPKPGERIRSPDYFTIQATYRVDHKTRSTVSIRVQVKNYLAGPYDENGDFIMTPDAKVVYRDGVTAGPNECFETESAPGLRWPIQIKLGRTYGITPERLADQLQPLFDLAVNDPPSALIVTDRCLVCSRPLTDEKSRDVGIGPDCYPHFKRAFVGSV